jgi:hypothetical protein
MVPSLDIFKLSGGDVLWRDAVATLETAKARIHKLELSSPGEYFVLNQKTGQRIFMRQLSSQIGYPIVESRNGPRIDMGWKRPFSRLGVFWLRMAVQAHRTGSMATQLKKWNGPMSGSATTSLRRTLAPNIRSGLPNKNAGLGSGRQLANRRIYFRNKFCQSPAFIQIPWRHSRKETRYFPIWITAICSEQPRASTMDQQRSTLRFPFVAAAEIAPESSPSASITSNVKELSLHECYADSPAPFSPKNASLVEDFQVLDALKISLFKME